MSRTTRSAGSSEGLANHGGNERFREVPTSAPCSLHQGVQLLVGESLKGLVNALQPCACPQEEGQDLLGKLFPLPLGEGYDLFRQSSFTLALSIGPTPYAPIPRILRQEL